MAKFHKPNFPANAFASTASYYARYRPPYPKTFLDNLIMRHRGSPDEERLLDLACGPGRVALPLAAHFRCVTAIDLEPEMIAEAKDIAKERAVANVSWLVGRAEDFEAPADPIDMITIGDAYHRVDQARVLDNALAWLRRRGSFIVLGSNPILSERPTWQRAVIDIVQKWTGQQDGGYIPLERIVHDTAEGAEGFRAHGFEDVAGYSYATSIVWTVDSLIGRYYSTSFCSRAVLGANADVFADDMKRALAEDDPGRRFVEQWRFGYTYGRKPAN
jgi:ubiquinone/menaquinone biosynthesis C-methylase UbiE